MLNVLIWGLTALGTVPAVLLALQAAFVLRRVRQLPAVMRYGGGKLHDTFCTFQIGSLSLTIYPRVWPVVLIAAGAVCLVAGLKGLLSSPT